MLPCACTMPAGTWTCATSTARLPPVTEIRLATLTTSAVSHSVEVLSVALVFAEATAGPAASNATTAPADAIDRVALIRQ